METDRLMIPSKDLQRTVEHLWTMVRQAGDALSAQQGEESEARVRVAYLESELESMASTVQSQNAALEQLRDELQKADSLRGSLDEVNARNAELHTSLEEVRAELEGARRQAMDTTEADAAYADLQSEMTAVTIRAQNMENVLQERGRDLAAAHVEMERLRNELEGERAESARRSLESDGAKSEMEALVADLRDQATRLAAESAQRESEWAAEKRDLQTRIDGALAAQANDTGSAAKYSSLVDEMSVTIAELEQKVQTAESRLQEYEELKKKSSKAPTLIEGMLRADVESLSARVAQLEEERTLWSHETTDDAIAAASSQDRKERLNGIAEKLRTAIAILERSTGSH